MGILLVLLLAAGCGAEPAPVVRELPEPRPFEFTEFEAQVALEDWVRAYNERDLETVLAYFSDEPLEFSYGTYATGDGIIRPGSQSWELSYSDCGVEERRTAEIHTRTALRDWVLIQWEREDHLELVELRVSRPDREAAQSMMLGVIEARRSNARWSGGAAASSLVTFEALPDGRALFKTVSLAAPYECS